MELVRIAGRYRLNGRMSSGSPRTPEALRRTSFIWLTDLWTDEIHLAHDVLSRENVVVKLEPVEGEDHTLEHEYCVYTKLKGLRGGTGIPRVHWFGIEDGFYAMVVESLGPSLEDLFVRCRFKFTVKTVLLLAGQLVSYLIPTCL